MRKKRRPVISAGMFFKYAACPHWLYFDEYGDPKKKASETRFSEMLRERGLVHEREMVAGRELVEPQGRTPRARFRDTLRLMREGADLIYHGQLLADGLSGEPDLLEKRTDRRSDLGEYHYVAIDIKSAERLTDAHRYQLTCYADLLQRLQGIRPMEGYILNGSGVTLSFAVDEFWPQYETALDDMRLILAGHQPSPHLSAGCKQSPWFDQCISLAEGSGDIALLYNVRRKVLDVLREHGVRTVEDAAAMDIAWLSSVSPRLSRTDLDRVRLQARALLEGRHFVREPVTFPETGTEIFFDIEGDPLRTVEYLFGFLVRENRKERYEHLLAESPEDEGRMWQEALAWMERLSDDFTVYHFGTYEISRLDILEHKYGGAAALDRFRSRMIDLNEAVKSSVVFPLYFYGLKYLGAHIGFRRSTEIGTGAESVAFYEEWLESGDRDRLQAIIRYNRDDVEETRALKDWLDEKAVEADA